MEEQNAPGPTDDGSTFVSTVVLDAFRKVREKLETTGRMVTIEYSGRSARVMVVKRGKLELSYKVTVPNGDPNTSPEVETRFIDIVSGKEVRSQPESLSRGGELLTLGSTTRENIEESFYEHYRAVTKGRGSAP